MFARGRDVMRGPSIAVLAAIGAIVAAASLAEEGEHAIIGIVIGALAAAFAANVSYDVLAGALKRAQGNEPGSKEADAANFMIVAFAAAGIVLAALSLFVPPVSLVALAALIWLAVSRRRHAGEKYEGLRILR
jgi:cobalamin synthase